LTLGFLTRAVKGEGLFRLLGEFLWDGEVLLLNLILRKVLKSLIPLEKFAEKGVTLLPLIQFLLQ
jgi:hypothetical protein